MSELAIWALFWGSVNVVNGDEEIEAGLVDGVELVLKMAGEVPTTAVLVDCYVLRQLLLEIKELRGGE